ncbi:hypothetical protein J6590_032018 [Homalodisca vitripennis]|nr:hypothetical protein J6590_032018 [Homalodisca vitripennis]
MLGLDCLLFTLILSSLTSRYQQKVEDFAKIVHLQISFEEITQGDCPNFLTEDHAISTDFAPHPTRHEKRKSTLEIESKFKLRSRECSAGKDRIAHRSSIQAVAIWKRGTGCGMDINTQFF